jgi:hypothetical protein
MSEEAEGRYVNGEYVRLTDYVPERRGRYAQDHDWNSTRDFPTGRLAKRLEEFFINAERGFI